DDPCFNAGHGAALTRDGAAELDAAIMDGRQLRAGAVASVRHVRNPIELARRVMEKSRHVLLVGSGAEEFALEESLVLVPNLYFRTAERQEQLGSEQRGERVSDLVPAAQGSAGTAASSRSVATGRSSWTSAPKACSAARATRPAGARSRSTDRAFFSVEILTPAHRRSTRCARSARRAPARCARGFPAPTPRARDKRPHLVASGTTLPAVRQTHTGQNR